LVWINRSAGLSAYNGSAWVNYTAQDIGFSSGWVAALLGRDRSGNLWARGIGIATLLGAAARFDGGRWTVYNRTDGLLTPPGAMGVDHLGRVWFAEANTFSVYFDPWQPSEQTVKPASGGLIVSPDGSTVVSFPAGADSHEISATLTKAQPVSTGELAGIGHFFHLTAVISGTTTLVTQFDKPFTITVDYKDVETDAVQESSLGLYTWDGSRWTREPSGSLDAAGNRLTAALDHLTLFAILGQPKPVSVPTKLYLPLLKR
jgi:hypothetical protein